MNYQVKDGSKTAGVLDSLGHLITTNDQDLQHVFFKMQKQGITVLSAPAHGTAKGIYADAAITTQFKDATPEQIFSELSFAGYEVLPEDVVPETETPV
jgi:hypothetical protein